MYIIYIQYSLAIYISARKKMLKTQLQQIACPVSESKIKPQLLYFVQNDFEFLNCQKGLSFGIHADYLIDFNKSDCEYGPITNH